MKLSPESMGGQSKKEGDGPRTVSFAAKDLSRETWPLGSPEANRVVTRALAAAKKAVERRAQVEDLMSPDVGAPGGGGGSASSPDLQAAFDLDDILNDPTSEKILKLREKFEALHAAGDKAAIRELREKCAERTKVLFAQLSGHELVDRDAYEMVCDIVQAVSLDAKEIYQEMWRHKPYAFMNRFQGKPAYDKIVAALKNLSHDATHPIELVELGPGAGFGAAYLIEQLREKFNIVTYRAIDVSEEAVKEARARVGDILGHENVHVTQGDFAQELRVINEEVKQEAEEAKKGGEAPKQRLIISVSSIHYDFPEAMQENLNLIGEIVDNTRGLAAIIMKHAITKDFHQGLSGVVMRETNGSGMQIIISDEDGLKRLQPGMKALRKSVEKAEMYVLQNGVAVVNEYDKGVASFNFIVAESANDNNTFTES